jgi:microcin C transport system substrate-binding protein
MTGTADTALDKMVDEYRYSGNESRRIELSKKIQRWVHDDAAFVPAVTTTWTRVGFWRWWRFPKPAGTKVSKSVASLFDTQWGGLLWFDQKIYDETKSAMKSKKSLGKLDILDTTYKLDGKASE